ncbi:unnamed protein product [Mycena citricolor]|uniref:Uncharacterized protein n=1 Tax=Mycena citricolor TaxID=2018698 RepID=A0AAD2HFE6_9AGAR|nr:unnamed protein product [Mycena citricolor]
MSSPSQATPVLLEDPQALQAEITLFDAFSIIGLLSLTFVVLVAHYSPNVHRTPLWFRHLVSWIVYTASFTLLVGHQFGGPPPLGLCAVQAALIHAVPVLWPDFECLITQLYIGLSAIVQKKRKIHPNLTAFVSTPSLLANHANATEVPSKLLRVPQLVFVVLFIMFLGTIQSAGEIQRDDTQLYCHLATPSPARISALIVIATGAIIVPLEIWIVVVLCRNWAVFRGSAHRKDPTVSLSILIRMNLFTVLSMTGVGLSSFSLLKSHTPFWSLTLTIVPILAAIIFGTQADLLSAYVFWREPETAPAETVHLPASDPEAIQSKI